MQRATLDMISNASKKKHVAVLGAGMCGLKTIKELLDANIEVTAFELSEDIGGIWRFTENEDESISSSVYRSTRINTLRIGNSFTDFPIPEGDFPVSMTHYDMMRYFRAYAEEFGLCKHIKFNTKVLRIEPGKARNKNGSTSSDWTWKVETESKGGEVTESTFDGVVICSGHHSIPRKVQFDGLDSFPGLLMHSHTYKDNSKFVGKRCVVVGIGNSGSDIATEISKVAKETILVARNGVWVVKNPLFDKDAEVVTRLDQNILGRLPQDVSARMAEHDHAETRALLEKAGLGPTYAFNQGHPTLTGNSPENNLLKQVEEGKIHGRRGIDHFEGSTVHFTDGTTFEADAVIQCTGYKLAYPYLDPEVFQVQGDNEVELYKYMFPLGHKKVDNIAFVGVVQQLGALAMVADVQSRIVAKYMAGDLQLPSRQLMKEDIVAKRKFNADWYYSAPRHTIQVSLRPYLDEIGEMIDATPTLTRILSQNPSLLWLVYSTPTCGSHYRLFGYGAKPELAKYNMNKEYQHCFLHMKNRTLLGGVRYYANLFGVKLPMAAYYQAKSFLTTGKTFFFCWE